MHRWGVQALNLLSVPSTGVRKELNRFGIGCFTLPSFLTSNRHVASGSDYLTLLRTLRTLEVVETSARDAFVACGLFQSQLLSVRSMWSNGQRSEQIKQGSFLDYMEGFLDGR